MVSWSPNLLPGLWYTPGTHLMIVQAFGHNENIKTCCPQHGRIVGWLTHGDRGHRVLNICTWDGFEDYETLEFFL